MKRICEFCSKEYDWIEGQPKWIKPNSEMKPTDRNAISSEKYCCYKCGSAHNQQKRKNTIIKRYGVINISQLDSIKEKIRKTNLKRYGVEYLTQSKKIMKKIRKTNLKKYGVYNVAKNKKVRNKINKTCLKKYGAISSLCSPNVKKKIEETNLKKYGYTVPIRSPKVQEKRKQTCLKKYGVLYSIQSEQAKNKSRQTCLERYGVEYSYQSPEILQKVYNSKKLHKTFNTTKPENDIYLSLCKKFPDTKTQYKSDKYPFACDFYIPELDLYIEYQGYWVHGIEPYNPINTKHQELVEKWKSKNKPQYQKAIRTWTERDPMKRQTAKDNNLNWIEFFTMDQFMEWYNKQ